MKMIEAPRSAHLHASDFAAIAGFDPYRTAMDVYMEKVEGIQFQPDEELQEAIDCGIMHEPAIIRWWAKKNDIDEARLVRPVTTLHPKHPEIALTPDRFVIRETGRFTNDEAIEKIVEAKSASEHLGKLYGDQGTNDVPEKHLCQVGIYRSAVEHVRGANIAVIIGGNKRREYYYTADVDFEAALIETGLRFWRNHVINKVPPSMDASQGAKAYLAKRFPKSNGIIRKAAPEEIQFLERYKTLYQSHKDLEHDLEIQKNIVKQLIGDDKGIEWEGGHVTYNSVAGRKSTDYEAVARNIMKVLEASGDSSSLAVKLLIETEIRVQTKVGQGYRRMLPKFE